MASFADLLQQGSAHAWLFIPTAILLGALHGLEPGHSKTMMAAFIIAIRGTVGQAVMLGLAAAFSHTLVVWVVALGGQYLGRNIEAETVEPVLQLASAVIVAGIALWMIHRTWREGRRLAGHHHHDHHHGHHHGHHHPHHGHGHGEGHLHHGHDHHHDHHEHDHAPHHHDTGNTGLDLGDAEEMDAHARAHAADIARRFQGQTVTNGQILMFGLTGGLVPCPAAITVLLLCLQLKQLALGAVMVASFSLGLAITMVAAGVIAALGLRHVEKRWSGFGTFARRAPYASGVLMLVIALYMAWSGWSGLSA